MGADILVVRHPTPGTPHLLAQHVGCSIINAGDGAHEHPTQALLDLMTIRRAKGRIEGLTVGLLGDISHSRVARSNIYALTKLGARVILCGPPTLVPQGVGAVRLRGRLPARRGAAALRRVNVLRIQFERQQRGLFPSVSEYSQFYMMTQERVRLGEAGPAPAGPGADQPRRRADPGGRRRPALGHPRPGHQRPGGADGRALPAQRPDRARRASGPALATPDAIRVHVRRECRAISVRGPDALPVTGSRPRRVTLPTIQISGGRIIDPSQGLDQVGDLWISRGRILPMGGGSEEPEVVIDARGLIVCPGLIDIHVHLREPGNEEDETIATGAAAALAGGVTSVACMPNTLPAIDTQAAAEFVVLQAQRAPAGQRLPGRGREQGPARGRAGRARPTGRRRSRRLHRRRSRRSPRPT